MSNNCVTVDESDLVFDGNMLELIHLNLFLLLLQVCVRDDDIHLKKGCCFYLVHEGSCLSKGSNVGLLLDGGLMTFVSFEAKMGRKRKMEHFFFL